MLVTPSGPEADPGRIARLSDGGILVITYGVLLDMMEAAEGLLKEDVRRKLYQLVAD